jgi:hypothetical protein
VVDLSPEIDEMAKSGGIHVLSEEFIAMRKALVKSQRKEKNTNTWIDAALKKHGAGVLYYRPVPGVFGARFLDYVVCAYGFYIAIEAKREGKDATDKQYLKLKDIEAAGGATFVIDSQEDVAALAKFLNFCKNYRVKGEYRGEWPTIPERKVEVL